MRSEAKPVRASRHRPACALAALGMMAALIAAVTSATRADASPQTAAPGRRASVRDSPGWYPPPPDPESVSVVVGRRLNAPAVSVPFLGGARSLDDLGRLVCRALHHSAADSLLALCVTESEFRDILWREFPQSRPATGLTWEDGWSSLAMRLMGGCRGAVSDYEFLRFERMKPVDRYRNFKLHAGLVLVTRDETGQIQRFTWLRAVAERRGVFKIYSTTD
jgi:hypothetical protein